MLATRALSYSVRGNYSAAAEWAERAVRSPNAHIQIFAIAAFTNELDGNRLKAQDMWMISGAPNRITPNLTS